MLLSLRAGNAPISKVARAREYGRIRPYSVTCFLRIRAHHFGHGSNASFGQSQRGSCVCFLNARLKRKASQYGAARLLCIDGATPLYGFVRQIMVLASAALAAFASRASHVWFRRLRARLWRFVACATCFSPGQSQRARRCKRSLQVPNNGLTRRCTRPPTALRFARASLHFGLSAAGELSRSVACARRCLESTFSDKLCL
jgi:hypothetical protein